MKASSFLLYLRARFSFVTFLQLARKAGGPMKVFFQKIPLALSSLVLALFSLSNQISHYTLIAQGIWCLASIGFILILGRLILGFEQIREDLRNPVVASAFASFFMAGFSICQPPPTSSNRLKCDLDWTPWTLYCLYYLFQSAFYAPTIFEPSLSKLVRGLCWPCYQSCDSTG